MRAFKSNLEQLKGRWLATVDDSPFNRDLFSDCKFQAVKTRNGSPNARTHGSQTFGELIITPPGA